MNKNIVLYNSSKDIYTLNPTREKDIHKVENANPKDEYITKILKIKPKNQTEPVKIEGVVLIDMNKKMIFEETLFYDVNKLGILYKKIPDLKEDSYILVNNDNTGTIFS